ncbi:hypothetical protein B0H14DRAFT_3456831 [Mycena olivaceomarginata]|nr:hypothetical protein B0H14DRAFT_3456831 [Mycena olivaceomarginata]
MDLCNHPYPIEPDGTLPAPQYYYATPEHDQYAAMANACVQCQPDLHRIQQQYHPNITFISSHQYQSSQPHVPVSLPLPASPPSPSADMYDPLPPPLPALRLRHLRRRYLPDLQHIQVLFDVMTHTLDGSSGIGDHGKTVIHTFFKKHECVNRCHNLHLSRDGFAEGVREESDEE